MDQVDKFFENTSQDLLIKSKVPAICKREGCMLGIDEAGRGPVLGNFSVVVLTLIEREQLPTRTDGLRHCLLSAVALESDEEHGVCR